MQLSIVQSALVAAVLLLPADLSLAADNKSGPAGEAKVISSSKAAEKTAKTAKAATLVKLVDINSAGKADLKTLPGISDAEADKIIAGRPYGSKAQLTTRNIVSGVVYANLRTLVIAKQKQNPAAKPGQK